MQFEFYIMLALLVLGIAFRIPIAFSMICSGIIYLFVTKQDVGLVAEQIMTTMGTSYVMLAIPLFIITANLMNAANITDKLWNAANTYFGKYKGGDSHVTVILHLVMSSMSGSAIADAAGPGLLSVKQQKERGYPPGFAVAVAASAATLGPIIPPSIGMILYCIIANTSISAMFLGGLFPGVLMAIMLMIVISIVAKYKNLPLGKIYDENRLVTLAKGIIPMTVPIIMLGGIWTGVFTPTEAAAIGGGYALLLGVFLYKKINFKILQTVFIDSSKASVSVMLMIAGAFIINYILASEQVAGHITEYVLGKNLTSVEFLLLINVIFLLAGCVIDTTTLLLVIVPLLLPSLAALGIHPVHFGVLIILNITIGLVTPPYGMLLFVLSGLTNTKLSLIFKEIWVFLIPLILALITITMVPEIVLWLPRLLKAGV